MNKCPRDEKMENLTLVHHFKCPKCGVELDA
jgi:predicted RNA-binding Zn-ribbon protein involved in translation (DUF1610 family)